MLAPFAVPCARAGAGAPAEFSLALLAGLRVADPHLADYQWDTRPRAAWGASGAFARGPWALGLRLESAATVQRLDLPGGPVSPRVRSTALELLVRRRIASPLGVRVSAEAVAGRQRIDYRPDHLAIAAGGPGTPLDVAFAPLDSWVAGGGMALARPLAGRWSLGFSLDRRLFALDTAHRNGEAVVNQRESFGDWTARVELARAFAPGAKGASR